MVTLDQLEEGVRFKTPSGRLLEMVISGNVARDITPGGWTPPVAPGAKKSKKKPVKAKSESEAPPNKIFTFGELAIDEGYGDDPQKLLENITIVEKTN